MVVAIGALGEEFESSEVQEVGRVQTAASATYNDAAV